MLDFVESHSTGICPEPFRVYAVLPYYSQLHLSSESYHLGWVVTGENLTCHSCKRHSQAVENSTCRKWIVKGIWKFPEMARIFLIVKMIEFFRMAVEDSFTCQSFDFLKSLWYWHNVYVCIFFHKTLDKTCLSREIAGSPLQKQGAKSPGGKHVPRQPCVSDYLL